MGKKPQSAELEQSIEPQGALIMLLFPHPRSPVCGEVTVDGMSVESCAIVIAGDSRDDSRDNLSSDL
ncbi:hypothetical protein KIN20_028071 [Parelaphostrongylus tenuis]|uniref:Uncharacterized protein n=1 Tax=Parelaphostrongylus tenuis TaxID=148309 RepID=A0AAD5WEI2_PARTN|nr:hypothetical protein KIN20_028071 [Parelaphostrongylus tenuis]